MSQYDPCGYDQHEPGAKLDGGKLRLDLVHSGFCRALRAVGEVATYGADKYTENGWREVPDPVKRYTAALYRHLSDWEAGEYVDRESTLPHLAHAAWNLLAVLEFKLEDMKEWEDDKEQLYDEIMKDDDKEFGKELRELWLKGVNILQSTPKQPDWISEEELDPSSSPLAKKTEQLEDGDSMLTPSLEVLPSMIRLSKESPSTAKDMCQSSTTPNSTSVCCRQLELNLT